MNQGTLFDFPVPASAGTIDRTIPVNIWLCGQVPSQKQRAGRYTAESNAHPAKMLPEIARRIIQMYSRPGDLILDPMAGIGTTLVEAMHLGRRAIGVELEQKFVTLAQGNIDLAAAQGAPGQARIIQGDARDLSGLDAIIDQIIMSPPYGNRMHDTDSYEARVARMKEQGVKHDRRWNSPAGCAGGVTRQSKMAYSDDPNNGNIGHLSESRYGSIDEVIFSPPYPNANTGGKSHTRLPRNIGVCATTLSDDPDNIDKSRLPRSTSARCLRFISSVTRSSGQAGT